MPLCIRPPWRTTPHKCGADVLEVWYKGEREIQMLPIHLAILAVLRRDGPQSIERFNEGACDGLFRNRFIALVPGFEPARIQISEKGTSELDVWLHVNNAKIEDVLPQEPERSTRHVTRVHKRKVAEA